MTISAYQSRNVAHDAYENFTQHRQPDNERGKNTYPQKSSTTEKRDLNDRDIKKRPKELLKLSSYVTPSLKILTYDQISIDSQATQKEPFLNQSKDKNSWHLKKSSDFSHEPSLKNYSAKNYHSTERRKPENFSNIQSKDWSRDNKEKFNQSHQLTRLSQIQNEKFNHRDLENLSNLSRSQSYVNKPQSAKKVKLEENSLNESNPAQNTFKIQSKERMTEISVKNSNKIQIKKVNSDTSEKDQSTESIFHFEKSTLQLIDLAYINNDLRQKLQAVLGKDLSRDISKHKLKPQIEEKIMDLRKIYVEPPQPPEINCKYYVTPKISKKIVESLLSTDFDHSFLIEHVGSGKTTALKVAKYLLEQKKKVLPIYLSLAEIKAQRIASPRIWRHVFEQISSLTGISVQESWEDCVFALQEEFPNYKIPILLDDAEILCKYGKSPITREFLELLEYRLVNDRNECRTRISFLLCGTHDFMNFLKTLKTSKRLFTRPHPDGRPTGDIHGHIFESRDSLHFQPQEIQLLIKQLKNEKTIKINEGDFAKKIFTLTKGYPDLTRICIEEIENCSEDRQPNKQTSMTVDEYTNWINQDNRLLLKLKETTPYREILKVIVTKISTNRTNQSICFSKTLEGPWLESKQFRAKLLSLGFLTFDDPQRHYIPFKYDFKEHEHAELFYPQTPLLWALVNYYIKKNCNPGSIKWPPHWEKLGFSPEVSEI
ncbi:hypothetical protein G9A89_015814 [Geosiphon pyriformis]|nr:hypothetical protein G9A89_015814 [Geosiphon pyriformis]